MRVVPYPSPGEILLEELVEMAKKFREAANRGEALGLSEDEIRFYDSEADITQVQVPSG